MSLSGVHNHPKNKATSTYNYYIVYVRSVVAIVTKTLCSLKVIPLCPQTILALEAMNHPLHILVAKHEGSDEGNNVP